MIIHHTLRAAIAAAIFVVNATSQSTSRAAEPRDRSERAQQDPRDTKGAKARMAKQRDTGGAECPPCQPDGETKTGERAANPAEQAKAFLAKHPEVRTKLFHEADADGDGKLSPAECEQLKRLVTTAMGDGKEQLQEQRTERREKTGQRVDPKQGATREQRPSTKADCGDEAPEWAIDGDGCVVPRERAKVRADGKDGRVAPRERERKQPANDERRSQSDQKSRG